MNLLLITNLIAISALLVVTFKFWRYKIYAKKEIASREQQIAEMFTQREHVTLDLRSTKSELDDLKKNKSHSKFTDNILHKNKGGEDINGGLQPLLDEIEMLRKEKEEEMQLRLEAEKQIELALQKTSEIQKRMNDWKKIQDASMKDSKDAIIEVGNDLYQRLTKSHKIEFDEEKNLFDNGIKNVSSYLEQINKKIEFLEKNDVGFTKEMRDVFEHSPDNKYAKPRAQISQTNLPNNQSQIIDETKEIAKNLEEYFKKFHYISKKDYFFDHDVNHHENSKLMFADCIFVKQDKLYIFDFKSQHYFENYKARSKNTDQQKLSQVIKEKLDKYLSYLSNSKYKSLILTLASNYNLKFENISIIAVILSSKELEIIKKIGYLEEFSNHNLKIMNLEEINKIISL